MDKILRTLIELCVGNYYNQAVVYERQIIDALNAVFRCDVFIPDGNDSLPVEVRGSYLLKFHTAF